MSRRAVVTGAASGIGAATVRLLREQAWEVVAIDRDWGSPVSTGEVSLDVSDHVALREAITGIGEFDALINNAAVMESIPLPDLDAESIKRTLDINLTAAIVASGAAAGALAARAGAIVNVASVHAVATSDGLAAYAAAKGGLLAFTRAAAVELGAAGVRVNAVVPGAVDTPMLVAAAEAGERVELIAALAARTPLKRVAIPSEIAEAIAFLADGRRAGFITGEALTADGGALARLSTE